MGEGTNSCFSSPVWNNFNDHSQFAQLLFWRLCSSSGIMGFVPIIDSMVYKISLFHICS